MSTYITIEVSGQRSDSAIHGIYLKMSKYDQHTEANIKALQSTLGWRIYGVTLVEVQDPKEAEWRKQVAHGQTKLGFIEWKSRK